jgi:hypothetical protein
LVTNQQLYLAIGVPLVFNALLAGILIAYINAKIDGADTKIEGVNTKIEGLTNLINAGFSAIDKRFDDMRDLWRAELRRVEEVLDAGLKHLEERRP